MITNCSYRKKGSKSMKVKKNLEMRGKKNFRNHDQRPQQ